MHQKIMLKKRQTKTALEIEINENGQPLRLQSYCNRILPILDNTQVRNLMKFRNTGTSRL
jgi:hypothetical protein